MSLSRDTLTEIPQQTQEVARAAFPKGNRYMRMRDELGRLYRDEHFAELYPSCGQPGVSAWRQALVLVMQFSENLSDRQAVEAVRARIDWKYALSLELTDTGFDHSVLSEFRSRLVAGSLEQSLLDTLLERFNELGWLKARGRQRSDATEVLAAIRKLNRLELVGESLRAALNELAVVAPQWLSEQVDEQWFDRYGRRIEEYRLPNTEAARRAWAEQVGRDGEHLLQALSADHVPPSWRALASVETLARVWEQQYAREGGQVRWRKAQELPCARERIDTPYDVEAHYATKRQTHWTGYKVHITESCDEACPSLITHVLTSEAPATDAEVVDKIHGALAAKGLPPSRHLVDNGYVEAQQIVQSWERYRIELYGPVMTDQSWQARAGAGYESSAFGVDWSAQQVRCPQGRVNAGWDPMKDKTGQPVIRVRFGKADCQACAAHTLCTQSKQSGRQLTLRPQREYEVLQSRRAEQETPEWKAEYNARAGIEAGLSQGVRAFGLRRTRYLGLAKTHLQQLATAAAINLARVDAWLTGQPRISCRRSAFAKLRPVAA